MKRRWAGLLAGPAVVGLMLSAAQPAVARPVHPSVTALSTHAAATTGGTLVTLHGRHLSHRLSVTVLGRPVGYRRISGGAIALRAPARSGPDSGWIRIRTAAGGISARVAAARFTYHWPAPRISSVSPALISSSGRDITVHGRWLLNVTSVRVGGVAPYYYVAENDGSAVHFPFMGAAGRYPVTITTPQGRATTTVTVVDPPAVTGVFPTDGSVAGGTLLYVHGYHFDGAVRVTVGGVPATHVVTTDSYNLTAVTPRHAVGLVDVQVTTDVDTSQGNTHSAYRYATVVPQTETPATTVDPDNVVSALSCVGEAFCMAIDNRNRYQTRVDGVWGPLSPEGSAGVTGLSCVSATFCLSGDGSYVWRWDGATWSPVPGLADSGPSVGVRAITCTSTTFCAVLDHRRVVVYNGASFEPALQPFSSPRLLTALSCWADGQCEVTDSYGYLAKLTDGTWVSDKVLAGPTVDRYVHSMQCSGPTTCFAGTGSGDVVTKTSATRLVLPGTVQWLDCTTATSCIAVGGQARATYADGVWSASTATPPLTSAESCSGDRRCVVAVGHDVRTVSW